MGEHESERPAAAATGGDRGTDGLAMWGQIWGSIRGRRGGRDDALPGLVAVAVLSPAMFVAVAHLAGVSAMGGVAFGTLFALLAWFHVLATRMEGWHGEGVVGDA